MGVFLDPAAISEETYPKAVVLHRLIAKTIDFLMVALLGRMIPPIGYYIGMTYLLIGDGFFHGKSIGKLLIGLQTVIPQKRKPASFRESILRNFPFLIGYLFFWFIPVVGKIIFFLAAGLELLLIIGNEKGLRIGDELAHTQVVDCESFDINRG